VAPFFFVLMDLSSVRSTYQFSLQWFTALFTETLQECSTQGTPDVRCQALSTWFAGALYTNVSRSLFPQDRLPFAILMLVKYLLVRTGVDLGGFNFGSIRPKSPIINH
jgi:dynein heavy chain